MDLSMMRRIPHLVGRAGLALLLLSACVPGLPGGPAPLPDGFAGDAVADNSADTCGKAALSGLVGQPGAMATAADRVQPVRVVPQGGAMTMDLDPTRLNVFLDAGGAIERLTCG